MRSFFTPAHPLSIVMSHHAMKELSQNSKVSWDAITVLKNILYFIFAKQCSLKANRFKINPKSSFFLLVNFLMIHFLVFMMHNAHAPLFISDKLIKY